jgi:hypothetical protein
MVMTKKTVQPQCLVILGIGSDDKPHAARFKLANEAVVRKAAELMSMRLGRAGGEQALKLTGTLPEGTLFATGKALVPLVKLDIYNELLKVLTFEPPAAADARAPAITDRPGPDAAKSAQATVLAPPDLWAAIKVGTVVLCRDDSDEPGWWESVVVSVGRDPENLVMRWRDWPRMKSFSVKRHAVALMGPAAVHKPA